MKRREFMMLGAAGAVLSGTKMSHASKGVASPSVKRGAPQRNRNPYKGPDWSLQNEVFGVNVLCVEERTVHACLKAYREGNFYGAAHGLDELAFTHLSFDGKSVRASTDKPARFEVITAQGVVKTVEGKEVSWDVVPDGSGTGPRVDVFARIRATAADGCGEVLYSQPFMLF